MTFRNQSVIDYSIVSHQALHFVKMFTVSELDALFSDGHALISTTLQLQQTSAIENKTLKQVIKKRPKLPENRKLAFVENLNRSKIQELSSLINETSVNQALVCKAKINSICLQFSEIFSESAKLSINDNPKGDCKMGKKVWFGPSVKMHANSIIPQSLNIQEIQHTVQSLILYKQASFIRRKSITT